MSKSHCYQHGEKKKKKHIKGGGGGVLKVQKKCHVLFEWPLTSNAVFFKNRFFSRSPFPFVLLLRASAVRSHLHSWIGTMLG